MEAADKGLQGGASFNVHHHLDAREGDPVDGAQGNLLQEPQRQPIDPHAALAAQRLQAEGQQGAALLQVWLQRQVPAGEVRELQPEVGVWAPAHQQRAGVMLQPLWDIGKGGQARRGVVQAHPQNREGLLHGQEPYFQGHLWL